MIRVVLDANIMVAALLGSGPPNRIVAAVFSSDQMIALTCPRLIIEVTDVLSRPKIRSRVSSGRTEEFLDNVMIFFHHVDDPAVIEPVLRDPGDDYLVALAQQHDVDWLVTGDKDLLDWSSPTVTVVSPADFEGAVLDSA